MRITIRYKTRIENAATAEDKNAGGRHNPRGVLVFPASPDAVPENRRFGAHVWTAATNGRIAAAAIQDGESDMPPIVVPPAAMPGSDVPDGERRTTFSGQVWDAAGGGAGVGLSGEVFPPLESVLPTADKYREETICVNADFILRVALAIMDTSDDSMQCSTEGPAPYVTLLIPRKMNQPVIVASHAGFGLVMPSSYTRSAADVFAMMNQYKLDVRAAKGAGR